MTIIEAREGWKGWISFKEDEIVYSVYFTKEDLLATDWQPYEQEKEKCGACITAENYEKVSVPYDNAQYFIARHLRQFHCQCKEGK